MLASDITAVANRTAVTLPGTTASAVFKLLPALSPNQGTQVRRVAGTQGTGAELKLIVTQQVVRPGKDTERMRTVVQVQITDNISQIGSGATLRPSAAATITLDRPTGPGAVSAITDAELTDGLAMALDVMLQNRVALLNGEN